MTDEYVWGNSPTQFFFELGPNIILNAIENLGFSLTGRYLGLNSMENRVYELEVERDSEDEDQFIIAKFYRPGRWTREQIKDEHNFLLELKNDEIPVIAPIVIDGESLFTDEASKLMYCVFPKRGGRVAQELTTEQLEITGRLLARIHNVGATKKADHRLEINPNTFGEQNLNFLLSKKIIPAHNESIYKDLVTEICELSKPLFKDIKPIRIHGDCHWGNIITRDEEISFIDFDDMLMGPAVQDVWLVVPGQDEQSVVQRNILLDSYETMRDFDFRTLKLIEPLRALRFIHFSAWIAKRWEDPSFKNAFVHFGDANYWDIQINDLRQQLILIKGLFNTYEY